MRGEAPHMGVANHMLRLHALCGGVMRRNILDCPAHANSKFCLAGQRGLRIITNFRRDIVSWGLNTGFGVPLAGLKTWTNMSSPHVGFPLVAARAGVSRPWVCWLLGLKTSFPHGARGPFGHVVCPLDVRWQIS